MIFQGSNKKIQRVDIQNLEVYKLLRKILILVLEIQISSVGINAQLKDDNAKQYREAMIANDYDIQHTMT